MDFKFSKDSDDSQSEGAAGEQRKQRSLLVLLLILVGGFAYLYFFTDLIKPQEAQKSAEVPPAPQVVKMALPPREGEPAKENVKVPEKTDAPKAATPAPVVAAAPAAKPPAAAAKPAPAPAAKPAPAKPKEEPQKSAAAKPVEKKPLPVTEKKEAPAAAAKSDIKKPVGEAKNVAMADKKSGAAKDVAKKPASAGQAKPEHAVKAKKDTPGPWSLTVGNYVLEEALSADLGRVRKAGFTPVVKPSVRKKTTMNRLFVSDFADRTAALSTLEKLKKHTSDAFVIEQGGRFAVYAGSYLQSSAASSEKERLKAAGFTATVRHADIAIPSQSLTVGPFPSKKAAEAARVKLKSAGLKATTAQQ